MPRTSSILDSPHLAAINALLRDPGWSLRAIARQLGVSEDALGRYAQKRRLRPSPAVSVSTPDEDALLDRVGEEYRAEVSRRTGIAVETLRRCEDDLHLASHPRPCTSCDALEATEPIWFAMADRAVARVSR